MTKLSKLLTITPYTGPGIGRQFAIWILAFSSVVTLVSTAVQLSLEFKRDVSGIEGMLEQVQKSYRHSLAGSLWVISKKDVQLQLDGILRLPDMQYLEVRTDTGKIVATAGSQSEHRILRQQTELYFEHQGKPVLVGRMIILASLEGAYQRIKDKVIVILFTQAIKTFLVSMFILFLFQLLIGRHLHKIAQHANTVDSYSEIPIVNLARKHHPESQKDELDQLVSALNNMRLRLALAYQKLRLSEENTRLMVEAIQDYAIIRLDQEGRVESWNQGAERIYGYPAEKVLGLSHAIFFTAEEQASNQPSQLLAQAQAQGQTSTEGLKLRQDGSAFWVEDSITALFDPNHELRGFSVVTRDITERKQTSERLSFSEALLRQSQSLAATGSWRLFMPHNELVWSDETYRIFGLPVGLPMDYETFIASVHPDDRAMVDAAWQAALQGEPYRIEHRILVDGATRWVEEHAEFEFDQQGKLYTSTGSVQDITERKLSESEQHRLSRALRLLSDCNLSLVHADNEQKLVNDVCRLMVETGGYMMAWVGLPQQDAEKSVRPVAQSGYEDGYLDSIKISWDESRSIGRGPTGTAIRTGTTQVNHNALSNPAMQPWREAILKRGYQSTIALPLLSHKQTLGAITVYAAEPEAFAADEVMLLEELASNVAFGIESLRSHEQLDAAEAASRAKSAFLANMSHEIRTPLNVITGMAHLIRRDGVSPQQQERLDQIDTAGQHLLEIINAILDLSKIEAGKFELEEHEIIAQEVASSVATMLAERAQDKALQLIVETDPLPTPLLGDATRLRQALLNYAANAIKFTDHGSITLRTRLVEENGDNVLLCFEVEDSGIGIAPEALSRLFSAFEQADNSMTRQYGGTGLGLAISKKLAQLMGGDAGVSSTEGHGSTFWYTARLNKIQRQTSGTSATAVTESAESVLARDYRGCRILLADDEPLNRVLVQEILNEIQPQIDMATNGIEALELATQNDYDLILMDMQMPQMNGIEATQKIRALAVRREAPIIAMTGNAFSEDRGRCIEAGMNDFIAKPFDIKTLFETILKWLSTPTDR